MYILTDLSTPNTLLLLMDAIRISAEQDIKHISVNENVKLNKLPQDA